MKYKLLNPIKGYEENYKIAQILMSTFEFSGCFSEVLLNKIYVILIKTIEATARKDFDDFNLKSGKGNRAMYVMKKFNEFKDIFETYSIFSDTFKLNCIGLFLTFIRQDLKP